MTALDCDKLDINLLSYEIIDSCIFEDCSLLPGLTDLKLLSFGGTEWVQFFSMKRLGF